MFLTDPQWLTALATLVTSLASLVWAFRRRGGGEGTDVMLSWSVEMLLAPCLVRWLVVIAKAPCLTGQDPKELPRLSGELRMARTGRNARRWLC